MSAVCRQQFPSYSNHNCKKSSFYVPRPSFFCLPWGRPCGNHAKRCMNEKTIQRLPNPSQRVPIYLQQFPSYSNRKCKQEAQLSLTDRAMLVCKVVEVWQDFLSEYVDKKFTYICYRRFGTEKLEWCRYPTVKKISKISVFVLTWSTNVTDGHTDRHCVTA